MKILIETIPHDQQRYPTVGDWQWEAPPPGGGQATLHIRVSAMSDWRYEALVGLHEAIEAILCKHAGVTEEQVDQFDFRWEPSDNENAAEPGDDPLAPYHHQHQVATGVEHTLAKELNVDWPTYESEINQL